MNTTGTGSQDFAVMLNRFRPRRGFIFGMLIVAALISFEIFNYSTTDFALRDLLGDLRFLGIRWATILALAFSGIDFAGIARLFTPEEGGNEQTEVWYLFGAWMLAATMNAMLTWWGVSLAVLNHQSLGNAVVEREMLLRVVPIFVAILVWLIRVLIIGTFSVAGDRLFSEAQPGAEKRTNFSRSLNSGRQAEIPAVPITRPKTTSATASSPAFRAAAKSANVLESGFNRTAHGGNGTVRGRTRPALPAQEEEEEEYRPVDTGFSRSEPTYHPVAMDGRRRDNNSQTRR